MNRLRSGLWLAAGRDTEQVVKKRGRQTEAAPNAPIRHTVDRYLSDDARLVKVVCRLEPTVPTTVMIAIEMPAAIRPYSMAVAPDSFARKSLSVFMTHP